MTTAELGNGERQVVIPLRLRNAEPRPRLSIATLRGETMGTTWSVKLAHAAELDCERLRSGIEQVLTRIVAQMSNWDGGSDLSRFNRAGAGSWFPLPADFHVVLDYALALAEDTGGAYDPTVGPLVDLWGFGPAGMRADLPRESDIETARTRCGHRKLTLDRKARCVLQPGGVSLDLCGIAKGYAVDCVASLLHEQGHRDYLVEIGGELRGEGEKPDGSPWWVALEAPRGQADTGRDDRRVARSWCRDIRRLPALFRTSRRALCAQHRSAPRLSGGQWSPIGDGAAPKLHACRCACDGAAGARARCGPAIRRGAQYRRAFRLCGQKRAAMPGNAGVHRDGGLSASALSECGIRSAKRDAACRLPAALAARGRGSHAATLPEPRHRAARNPSHPRDVPRRACLRRRS